MFYYVNGTVAETGPNLAVIDCGGVGYACATTNYTLSQLKKGERAKLYTYLHVREEIFELYGFSSQAELNSFKMLIGVSGVRPRRVGGAGLRLSGDRPGPEGHRHGRPAPGGDHPSGSEKNGAVRRRMHEH